MHTLPADIHTPGAMRTLPADSHIPLSHVHAPWSHAPSLRAVVPTGQVCGVCVGVRPPHSIQLLYVAPSPPPPTTRRGFAVCRFLGAYSDRHGQVAPPLPPVPPPPGVTASSALGQDLSPGRDRDRRGVPSLDTGLGPSMGVGTGPTSGFGFGGFGGFGIGIGMDLLSGSAPVAG
jgi:hypothetical protein